MMRGFEFHYGLITEVNDAGLSREATRLRLRNEEQRWGDQASQSVKPTAAHDKIFLYSREDRRRKEKNWSLI